MHMFGIGARDGKADLLRRIHVYVKIGADQLNQFDILKVYHVGAVTALNQCPLQLLLKPLHGIAKHDLLDLPLLQGKDRHIVVGGLHIEDIFRFD